jgi:hypothetical protein
MKFVHQSTNLVQDQQSFGWNVNCPANIRCSWLAGVAFMNTYFKWWSFSCFQSQEHHVTGIIIGIRPAFLQAGLSGVTISEKYLSEQIDVM